jgi:hypothetical protein
MASKIMIVRHGEKPDGDDSVRGVDPTGSHDPHELSVKGWQRSGALVRFFVPANGHFSHPALAKPDVIFAEGDSGHVKSLRAQHTVLALADFLEKHLNIKHAKGDEKELAKDAVATDGVVLIAWEHNAIIDIVNHITGDQKTCPQTWPDSRYDLVWVLDREPHSAAWKFTQVPQMLLPGDKPHAV